MRPGPRPRTPRLRQTTACHPDHRLVQHDRDPQRPPLPRLGRFLHLRRGRSPGRALAGAIGQPLARRVARFWRSPHRGAYRMDHAGTGCRHRTGWPATTLRPGLTADWREQPVSRPLPGVLPGFAARIARACVQTGRRTCPPGAGALDSRLGRHATRPPAAARPRPGRARTGRLQCAGPGRGRACRRAMDRHHATVAADECRLDRRRRPASDGCAVCGLGRTDRGCRPGRTACSPGSAGGEGAKAVAASPHAPIEAHMGLPEADGAAAYHWHYLPEPDMPLDSTTRARIETLLQEHPVVLFMKGDRQQPMCGFSMAATNTLNELLPDYHTVNVLEDAEIRQGIKEYGDWP